jgi:hypothetical protein
MAKVTEAVGLLALTVLCCVFFVIFRPQEDME